MISKFDNLHKWVCEEGVQVEAAPQGVQVAQASPEKKYGKLTELGHLGLDIWGLIGDFGAIGWLGPQAVEPVSTVVGGIMSGTAIAADLANSLWYAKEGRYLLASFSLISIIPGVGDVIGKGGKGIYLYAKLAKTAKRAGPAGRQVAKGMIKGRKIIVKGGKKVRKAQQVIQSNKVVVDNVLNKAEKNKHFAKHVPEMREALGQFTSAEYVDEDEVENIDPRYRGEYEYHKV